MTINLLSVFCIFKALFGHHLLGTQPFPTGLAYVGLVGILFTEIIFVYLVQRKARLDQQFARSVCGASPNIAKLYIAISVLTLFLAGAAAFLRQ